MMPVKAKWKSVLLSVGVVSIGLILNGCVQAEPEISPLLPQTKVCLTPAQGDPILLEIELARTPAQRSQGLMERDSLGEYAGMLFVYSYTQSLSFWMYNTLIPLDIAFLDEEGAIVDIQQMLPCETRIASLCPRYISAEPALMALEVNYGAFENWGVRVGDTLYNETCHEPVTGSTQW